MGNLRLVARLDIKGASLVKGIQLEGLRKLGDPSAFARKYYQAGIDEILYIDIVASLYQRSSIFELVETATRDIFVPITVGGGLRGIEDVGQALKRGADKVAINTAAIQDPGLVTAIARRYGSQCMVLSIQAKRSAAGRWEAYCNNGREHTGLDVVDWAKRGSELGAGEILLTSVDREGGGKGMDQELVQAVCAAVSIPVIAVGGVRNAEDIAQAYSAGASAVAMAHALHYERVTLPGLRQELIGREIPVRAISEESVTGA